MGTVREKILCLCISILAISWTRENLSASAAVLPLFEQQLIANLNGQQISSNIQSSPCTGSTSGGNSVTEKELLLDQARKLLEQLSSSVTSKNTQCSDVIENREKILLQNLINELEIFKTNSQAAAISTSSQSTIDDETYNTITKQYFEVRNSTADLLYPSDALIVQSELDALYKSFDNIINGQLANTELANLCSKILALNTQLNAINAPSDLQGAITDFITKLSSTLTGQSKITILGLCNSLNDLEMSIVTVVENDKSQRLQYLLSNLVDAVTNAVVSGGDIGCNVIDIVQRHVANIKQALQEETNVRAGRLYSIIMQFEADLDKVLFGSKPWIITGTSSSQTTTSSTTIAEEHYIDGIRDLSKSVFGDNTSLVKSAVEILLHIKNLENSTTKSSDTDDDATIETLKQVYEILKLADSASQTDSTQVVEAIVEQLSGQPSETVSKVLDALGTISKTDDGTDTIETTTNTITTTTGKTTTTTDKITTTTDKITTTTDKITTTTDKITTTTAAIETTTDKMTTTTGATKDPTATTKDSTDSIEDATEIVSNGQLFIIKGLIVRKRDVKGNLVDVIQNGEYMVKDQNTNTSISGEYKVYDGTIDTDSEGNLQIRSLGVYDVKIPASNSSSAYELQANFDIEHETLIKYDSNGNPIVKENGIYTLSNPVTEKSVSGNYDIRSSIAVVNTDGSVSFIKTGVLYVDNPDSPSPVQQSTPEDDVQYFFCNDHILASPDINGNLGYGLYNLKNPKLGTAQWGRYTIETLESITNPDKSIDSNQTGLIFVENVEPASKSDNSDSTGFKIVHGSNYTFNDHETRSTDIYGNVKIDASGVFTQIDCQTRLITTANYVDQIIMSTKNPDGSTDSIKFGIFSNVTVSKLSSKLCNIDSAKNVTVKEESLQAFINSLNAVKSVQPDDYNLSQSQLSTTDDETSDVTAYPLCKSYDAIKVLSNGSSFILDVLITPVVDPDGIIIASVKMGTCHVMDINTNVSWTIAFEAEYSSARITPSGEIKITADGTFEIAPPENRDNCYPVTGTFSLKEQLNGINYETSTGGVGLITLEDSISGTSLSASYVVENIITAQQPGNALEVVKTGLISLDESIPSPTPTVIPGYDRYFLVNDNVFEKPDDLGILGTGTYTFKDSETDKSTTRTFVITEISTTNETDGSSTIKTKRVIVINDFIPNPKSGNFDSSFVLTTNCSLVPVIDDYGHNSFIGDGEYSFTRPDTDTTETGKLFLLNIFTTENSDDSTTARIFGVSATQGNQKSTTGSPSTTTNLPTTTTSVPSTTTSSPRTTTSSPTTTTSVPSTMTSSPTTTTTSQPKGDYFVALLDTLNPIEPTSRNSQNLALCANNPSSTGSIGNAVENPIAVATDGAYFIINIHVVPLLDNNGNIIGQINTGNYSVRDSARNISSSGSFAAEDFTFTPRDEESYLVTSSGTFNVSLPDDSSTATTSSINEAIFSIKCKVYVDIDDQGVSRATENGSYILTNPITKQFTTGNFVVITGVSKKNPDNSIDIARSGILYVDRFCGNTNEQPPAIRNGGYFLTDQRLFEVPDSYGRQGVGVYNIKDPYTNEFTSGQYDIYETFIVENEDGTTNVTTKGLIYVDSTRSSTLTVNSLPALAIISGANFTFLDHFSAEVDQYGDSVIGTGIFIQEDDETNVLRSGNYVIQDMLNADDLNSIQVGIFYYTTDSEIPVSVTTTTTTSTTASPIGSSLAQTSNSDKTLKELNDNLQTLINSLGYDNASKDPVPTTTTTTTTTTAKPTAYASTETSSSDTTLNEVKKTLQTLLESVDSLQKNNGVQVATTLDSTSTTVQGTSLTSNYVQLPRLDVISAMNGQCLLSGDVVVVQDSNKAVLLGSIYDSSSPVNLYPVSLASSYVNLATAKRILTVQVDDFSKKDRTILDAVLKSTNAPCST